MRVIEDVRSCDARFPNVVLTIGSFDGVHLGHRRILDTVARDARAMGGTAALMTLRPHPRQFFSPQSAPNIITGDWKKEQLLAEAGIDVLYVLPFNADVANLDREAFVRQIVVGKCAAKRLVVGHDFNFGKGAQGNFEYLQSVAPEHGFAVEQAPALIIDGERVSSTLVREFILQGELDHAERFLGRKYSVVGEVITGRGMGRKLGYPTANIKPHNNAVPANGIYIAEARFEGRCFMAAVNIGIAPTISHEDIMIEAYLLDFDEGLVGKTLEIVFHKRIRPEKKFHSLEELITAIDADVVETRRFFATH
jgi:riboflavin kinase/FMN adenylyltransferase